MRLIVRQLKGERHSRIFSQIIVTRNVRCALLAPSKTYTITWNYPLQVIDMLTANVPTMMLVATVLRFVALKLQCMVVSVRVIWPLLFVMVFTACA